MSQSSSKSKYMNTADRKAQILSIACELFAKKSYDAVSLRAIAQRCNCSAALILKLFGSKEAIYCALLDEWRDECSRPWIAKVPKGDALDALESLFDLLVSGHDERTPTCRPNLTEAIVSRVAYRTEHLAIMQTQQNVAMDIIFPLIVRGQAAGKIKASDPKKTAELIWSIIYGTRMITTSYPLVNKVKFSLIKEIIL